MDAEERASKKTDEMPKMQTQDEVQGIRLCGQLCMVSLFLLHEMTTSWVFWSRILAKMKSIQL